MPNLDDDIGKETGEPFARIARNRLERIESHCPRLVERIDDHDPLGEGRVVLAHQRDVRNEMVKHLAVRVNHTDAASSSNVLQDP